MEQIDVALRLRPQLVKDTEDTALGSLGIGALVVQDIDGNNKLQLKKNVSTTPRRLSVSQSRGSGKLPAGDGFDTYDMSASGISVFGEKADTHTVYCNTCQRIVQSVMEGINGTCLAYGQTGSGKTYTMSGITDFAIDEIFSLIASTPQREYLLRLTILEIYNEQVMDLLNAAQTPCRLLEDPEDGPLGVLVEGATDIAIESADHLRREVERAYQIRHVGKTSQNDYSSRSHLIIRIVVDSKPAKSDVKEAISPSSPAKNAFDASSENTLSSLNLVDLAGSERLSQSHSQGQQLKETVKINQSLLCLGNVINRLSEGPGGYIPYRNSTLTRLLRHSLGGNARTAMICTLSPATISVEQSRKTIQFAGRAREVKNQVVVNTVGGDQLIRQYRKQIDLLRQQLDEYQKQDVKEDAAVKVDPSHVAKLELRLKQTEQQYKQANDR